MFAEHETLSPPHSCEVCESREYKLAELILLRSGLKREVRIETAVGSGELQPKAIRAEVMTLANWGALLHDIARGLRGELNEIEWQVK